MPFLILPMVFWIVILVGGFSLAARLVRAYEQKNASGGQAEALQERIVRLEEAIESVNTQLSRLSEAQRFTTRLLEGTRLEAKERTDVGEGSEPGPG